MATLWSLNTGQNIIIAHRIGTSQSDILMQVAINTGFTVCFTVISNVIIMFIMLLIYPVTRFKFPLL